MLKIFAEIKVKEGCKEEFLALAKELVAKSSAEEGNVSYSVNQSVKDPDTFAFIEIWGSQEAVAKHSKSEHFTTIFAKLQVLAAHAEPIKIFYEI
ncbi:MAG: antibiotic biosynthesis monooxygenase [Firmicutes bacterium]|nr:antibiotic biosynthesis monooxygenase [Bacillota bacterium]